MIDLDKKEKISFPSGGIILLCVMAVTLSLGVGGYYLSSFPINSPHPLDPADSNRRSFGGATTGDTFKGSISHKTTSSSVKKKVIKKNHQPFVSVGNTQRVPGGQFTARNFNVDEKNSRQLHEIQGILNDLSGILSHLPTSTVITSSPQIIEKRVTVLEPYFVTTTVEVTPSPEVFTKQDQIEDVLPSINPTITPSITPFISNLPQISSQVTQSSPAPQIAQSSSAPQAELAYITQRIIPIQPGYGQGYVTPTVSDQPVAPQSQTIQSSQAPQIVQSSLTPQVSNLPTSPATDVVDVVDPNLPPDVFDETVPVVDTPDVLNSTSQPINQSTDQNILPISPTDTTILISQSPLPTGEIIPPTQVVTSQPSLPGGLTSTQKKVKKIATKKTIKKISKKHRVAKAKKTTTSSSTNNPITAGSPDNPIVASSPPSPNPVATGGGTVTHHKTIVHKIPKNSNSSGSGGNYSGGSSTLPSDNNLSVVINEIMWGGSAASSHDEWIELYNQTNHDIDLSHITLESADGVPNIPLQGHIGPRKYYLIKRNGDTLPDVPANLTTSFGGLKKGAGLDNKGEVLSLVSSINNTKTILDSTPALSACKNKWCAGTAKPTYRSMERVCPNVAGTLPSNWKSNNMTNRNGHDRQGNAINGTPGGRNSEAHGNL